MFMLDERQATEPRDLEARADLLAQRGLSVPPRADLITGLWDGERLVATASLVGDVIQAVAVAPGTDGEGLASRLVGSLIRQAGEGGLWHLFLFTKPDEAATFQSLGFSLIAAESGAGLLEWGHPDLADWLGDLPPAVSGSAALVVNANPMTLGHLHLITEAAARAPRLFVLVVQEDRSLFPFEARLSIVKAATASMDNVTVLPGGPYLVSRATFPSYFTAPAILGQVHGELDARIFGSLIAPRLGITSRWVGTEPLSPETALYNQAMKQRLPALGVTLHEIPRLEQDGDPVSASRVRVLLAAGELTAVRPLVPEATWHFLHSLGGRAVIDRLETNIW